MNDYQLADKLRAIVESGISCHDIARKADCDVTTIYRIRSGSILNPKYSVGITIDRLYRNARRRCAA